MTQYWKDRNLKASAHYIKEIRLHYGIIYLFIHYLFFATVL